MDAERGRRNQPAIESCGCDDSFAVKNIGKVAAPCERPINGRHALSPCYFARQRALERATVSAHIV